jgi:signal transduction histidine kinase
MAGPSRIYAAATRDLGWFDRSPDGEWLFHSLLGDLAVEAGAVGELWQVVALPDGAVFAAADRLYWWRGRKMTVERLGGNRRLALLGAQGFLFLQDPRGDVWRIAGDRRERVLSSDSLGGATAFWIDADSAGSIRRMATSRGFVAVKDGHLAPIEPEASAAIRALGLTAVQPLPTGGMALATLRGGVVLLDGAGGVREQVDTAHGLPDNEVFGLTTDSESGLWMMGTAAIARISLQPITWFRDDTSAGEHPAIALARLARGWIDVTDDGTIWRESNPGVFSRDRSLNRHVWSGVAAGGNLFLARVGGVDRIGPHGLDFFLRRGGSCAVFGESVDQSALWVGSGDAVMRAPLDGTGPVVVVEHLPDAPTSVAEGGNGRLWVGTAAKGVFEVELPTGRLTRSSSIPNAADSSSWVVRAGNGIIFAFDAAGGWWCASGEGQFHPIKNFPRRPVAAFAAAQDGDVWVVHPDIDGSGSALARVRSTFGEAEVTPQWQPWLLEGLRRIGVPSCLFVESNGSVRRLGIGGSEGFIRAQLDVSREPPLVPAPELTVTQSPDDSVQIRAELKGFSLRPSLAVETFVEGVDAGWSRMDSRSRRLAALSPGRYTVRARIVAATGIAGSEQREVFSVSAPWWRRGWTMPVWVLALAAVAYQWARIRSSALRARAANLEAKVRARTAELEQVTAEKARLVAGIGHDLRNPLNGIVGIALALDETELGSKQRELLTAMRASARHLSGMIEDVIDFARLESNRGAIQREACSPAEILMDAVSIARSEAELAGADLNVEIDQGLPPALLTDPLRVRQILANFVSNAVKFAGGKILISARLVSDGRELEYSVVDYGPGIAADDQKRLGTPFARFNRTVPGAGLGLATSKRWAELLGGRMIIYSEVGKGFRVHLVLPILPPESAGQMAPAPARVLLVEDEEYSAWATLAVVERIGTGFCDRVRTAAEALERFQASQFDVVLVDQRLPDSTGKELSKALRRLPRGINARIIAVSGSAPDEDWRRFGADAFIAKPVTPGKLRSALNAANRFRLIRFLSDGTPEGFQSEVDRYLSGLRQLLDRLTAAFAASEAEEIRTAAHRLQSHFRMLDAEQAVAACGKLEDNPRLTEVLAEIRTAAAEVETWLGVTTDA